MKRRIYGAVGVNDVDGVRLAQGHPGLNASVGIDVGKYELLAVCRWADGRFERPWRIVNPTEIADLVRRIEPLRAGRQLVVALEPSGTYGDALRQALSDVGLEVRRVSAKAAHDYAEVLDGVPSQHDGKDAAVVAELAAMGKSRAWPYQAASEWEQELRYWVEWMVAQRGLLALWQGRLEGLLSRYWPEATRTLKLTSVTLLRVLERYGSAQALLGDPKAAERIQRWGGKLLEAKKVNRFMQEARITSGVRPGAWEVRRIQECARQALQALRQGRVGEKRLRQLGRGHGVLEAQAAVVGLPTACVLWVSSGDPRNFDSAGAYRKAMGLNLVERSSGTYQGQLHLSKRGSARSRQWLYFAALRLVQRCGIRRWYEAKKAQDASSATRVLVALMRKLALALYQVGVGGQKFDERRLAVRLVRGRQDVPKTATKEG